VDKRGFEIDAELTRLLAEQATFLKKTNHSWRERQQYEKAQQCVRELISERDRLAKMKTKRPQF
jgi:hypothetical protein